MTNTRVGQGRLTGFIATNTNNLASPSGSIAKITKPFRDDSGELTMRDYGRDIEDQRLCLVTRTRADNRLKHDGESFSLSQVEKGHIKVLRCKESNNDGILTGIGYNQGSDWKNYPLEDSFVESVKVFGQSDDGDDQVTVNHIEIDTNDRNTIVLGNKGNNKGNRLIAQASNCGHLIGINGNIKKNTEKGRYSNIEFVAAKQVQGLPILNLKQNQQVRQDHSSSWEPGSPRTATREPGSDFSFEVNDGGLSPAPEYLLGPSVIENIGPQLKQQNNNTPDDCAYERGTKKKTTTYTIPASIKLRDTRGAESTHDGGDMALTIKEYKPIVKKQPDVERNGLDPYAVFNKVSEILNSQPRKPEDANLGWFQRELEANQLSKAGIDPGLRTTLSSEQKYLVALREVGSISDRASRQFEVPILFDQDSDADQFKNISSNSPDIKFIPNHKDHNDKRHHAFKDSDIGYFDIVRDEKTQRLILKNVSSNASEVGDNFERYKHRLVYWHCDNEAFAITLYSSPSSTKQKVASLEREIQQSMPNFFDELLSKINDETLIEFAKQMLIDFDHHKSIHRLLFGLSKRAELLPGLSTHPVFQKLYQLAHLSQDSHQSLVDLFKESLTTHLIRHRKTYSDYVLENKLPEERKKRIQDILSINKAELYPVLRPLFSDCLEGRDNWRDFEKAIRQWIADHKKISKKTQDDLMENLNDLLTASLGKFETFKSELSEFFKCTAKLSHIGDQSHCLIEGGFVYLSDDLINTIKNQISEKDLSAIGTFQFNSKSDLALSSLEKHPVFFRERNVILNANNDIYLCETCEINTSGEDGKQGEPGASGLDANGVPDGQTARGPNEFGQPGLPGLRGFPGGNAGPGIHATPGGHAGDIAIKAKSIVVNNHEHELRLLAKGGNGGDGAKGASGGKGGKGGDGGKGGPSHRSYSDDGNNRYDFAPGAGGQGGTGGAGGKGGDLIKAGAGGNGGKIILSIETINEIKKKALLNPENSTNGSAGKKGEPGDPGKTGDRGDSGVDGDNSHEISRNRRFKKISNYRFEFWEENRLRAPGEDGEDVNATIESDPHFQNYKNKVIEHLKKKNPNWELKRIHRINYGRTVWWLNPKRHYPDVDVWEEVPPEDKGINDNKNNVNQEDNTQDQDHASGAQVEAQSERTESRQVYIEQKIQKSALVELSSSENENQALTNSMSVEKAERLIEQFDEMIDLCKHGGLSSRSQKIESHNAAVRSIASDMTSDQRQQQAAKVSNAMERLNQNKDSTALMYLALLELSENNNFADQQQKYETFTSLANIIVQHGDQHILRDLMHEARRHDFNEKQLNQLDSLKSVMQQNAVNEGRDNSQYQVAGSVRDKFYNFKLEDILPPLFEEGCHQKQIDSYEDLKKRILKTGLNSQIPESCQESVSKAIEALRERKFDEKQLNHVIASFAWLSQSGRSAELDFLANAIRDLEKEPLSQQRREQLRDNIVDFSCLFSSFSYSNKDNCQQNRASESLERFEKVSLGTWHYLLMIDLAKQKLNTLNIDLEAEPDINSQRVLLSLASIYIESKDQGERIFGLLKKISDNPDKKKAVSDINQLCDFLNTHRLEFVLNNKKAAQLLNEQELGWASAIDSVLFPSKKPAALSSSNLVEQLEKGESACNKSHKDRLLKDLSAVRRQLEKSPAKLSRDDIPSKEACQEYTKDRKKTVDLAVALCKGMIYATQQENSGQGYPPYDAQLIALLEFIYSWETGKTGKKGAIGQIETGEGKSWITRLTVAANALRGKYVNVITSKPDLAIRDTEESKYFYSLFGLECNNNCDYQACSNPTELKKRYETSHIMIGTAQDFERDRVETYQKSGNVCSERPNLKPNLPGKTCEHDGNENTCLFIDEVDSMLLDNSDFTLFLPDEVDDFRLFEDMTRSIWKTVSTTFSGVISMSPEHGTYAIYPTTLNEVAEIPEQLSPEEASLMRDIADDDDKILYIARVGDHYHIRIFNQEGDLLFDLGKINLSSDDTDITHQLGAYLKNLCNEESDQANTNADNTIEDEDTFIKTLLAQLGTSDIAGLTKFKSYQKVKQQLSDNDFHLPKKLLNYARKNLPNWIESAMTALSYEENREYRIEPLSKDSPYSKIVPIDIGSGVEQDSTQWTDLLHQFLQIKHGANMTVPTVMSAFESNMGFVQSFSKHGEVYGVTGTLGDRNSTALLCDLAQANHFKLPRRIPGQLQERPPIVVDTNEKWLETIHDKLRYFSSDALNDSYQQPVLVVCETVAEAELLYQYLNDRGLSISEKILSNKDMDAKGKYLEDVGKNNIFIATNISGRGTDIKFKSSERPDNGLHVILTYMPGNDRIEWQAKGRAARNGNPGSCQIIMKDSANQPVEIHKFLRSLGEAERVDGVRTSEIPRNTVMNTLAALYTEADRRFREKLGISEKNNDDIPPQKLALLNEAKSHWAFFVARFQRRLNEESYSIKIYPDDKSEDTLPSPIDKDLKNTVYVAKIGDRFIIRLYNDDGHLFAEKVFDSSDSLSNDISKVLSKPASKDFDLSDRSSKMSSGDVIRILKGEVTCGEQDEANLIGPLSKLLGNRVYANATRNITSEKVKQIAEDKINSICLDIGLGNFRFQSNQIKYAKNDNTSGAEKILKSIANVSPGTKSVYSIFARHFLAMKQLERDLQNHDNRKISRKTLKRFDKEIRQLIRKNEKDILHIQTEAQLNSAARVLPTQDAEGKPLNVSAQYDQQRTYLEAISKHIQSLVGASIAVNELDAIDGMTDSLRDQILLELENKGIVKPFRVSSKIKFEENFMKLEVENNFSSTAWHKLPKAQQSALIKLFQSPKSSDRKISKEDIHKALQDAHNNSKKWKEIYDYTNINPSSLIYAVEASADFTLSDIPIGKLKESTQNEVKQYENTIKQAVEELKDTQSFNLQALEEKLGRLTDAQDRKDFIKLLEDHNILRIGFKADSNNIEKVKQQLKLDSVEMESTGEDESVLFRDSLPFGEFDATLVNEVWTELVDEGLIKEVSLKSNLDTGEKSATDRIKDAIEKLEIAVPGYESVKGSLEDLLTSKYGIFRSLSKDNWEIKETTLASKLGSNTIKLDDPELLALIRAGLDILYDVSLKPDPLEFLYDVLKIGLEILISSAIATALASIPGASIVAQPLAEIVVSEMILSIRSGQLPSADTIVRHINNKLKEFDPRNVSVFDLIALFASGAGKVKKLNNARKKMQSMKKVQETTGKISKTKKYINSVNSVTKKTVKTQLKKQLDPVKNSLLESELFKEIDRFKNNAVNKAKHEANVKLEEALNAILPKASEGNYGGLRLGPYVTREIEELLQTIYRALETKNYANEFFLGIMAGVKKELESDELFLTLRSFKENATEVEAAISKLFNAYRQKNITTLVDKRNYTESYEACKRFGNMDFNKGNMLCEFPERIINKFYKLGENTIGNLKGIDWNRPSDKNGMDEFVVNSVRQFEEYLFDNVKEYVESEVIQPAFDSIINGLKNGVRKKQAQLTRDKKAGKTTQQDHERRANQRIDALRNGEKQFGAHEFVALYRKDYHDPIIETPIPLLSTEGTSIRGNTKLMNSIMTSDVIQEAQSGKTGIKIENRHAMPCIKNGNGEWEAIELPDIPSQKNCCYIQSLVFLKNYSEHGDLERAKKKASDPGEIGKARRQTVALLSQDSRYLESIGDSAFKRRVRNFIKFGFGYNLSKAGSKGVSRQKKGDHIFNNVVKTMMDAVNEGLIEATNQYSLQIKASAENANQVDEAWMKENLPKTFEQFYGIDNNKGLFKDEILVDLRNKLQTTDFQGGDSNENIYPSRVNDFKGTVKDAIAKIAKDVRSGVVSQESQTALRNAISTCGAMMKVAKDENAAKRFWEDQKTESLRKKAEENIEAVQQSYKSVPNRLESALRVLSEELRNFSVRFAS